MSTAYDLIDDWPTRTQIQNDVTEVLDAYPATGARGLDEALEKLARRKRRSS